MFESAELGHKIPKKEYNKQLPSLRSRLLETQYELLAQKRFAVVIVIAGVDGAGKGETVNMLNEWMDPRHIHTHALGAATDEESQQPPFFRYWRRLPPKGSIGVFFGSWYSAPLVDRVYRKINQAELDQHLEEVTRFEQMLTDEGVLLLKFWFHLSKKAQEKRLKSLEKKKVSAWRVTKRDWERFKLYDKFRRTAVHALRRTSTGVAPWVVLEGSDARFRNLTVGGVVEQALRRRLDEKPSTTPAAAGAPIIAPIDKLYLLQTLDLDQSMSKKAYDKEFEVLQGRLNRLTRTPAFQKRSVVAVFEGVDAAGKGGSIRRITRSVDARQYVVIPISAPTDEELAQPYLWRFWRRLPRQGKIAIFDRSWYGRLLVERVEGFAGTADWTRAFQEISDFEDQLHKSGTLVVKFWLQISAEEQLRRFKDREKVGFKRYKLTEDDWRNRDKWSAYERAACDMIDRTSTENAPWTIVEANDKYFARIKVMRTLCEQIERA